MVIALSFLLWRGLADATVYFRTADEAVSQRSELGTKRFRVEGTVVPGTIKAAGQYTNFSIASKGVTIPVRNEGQPVGIFQENIPVVLEGKFASADPTNNTFNSDQIMVKHSAEYEAEYPERTSGEANKPAAS